MAAFHVAPAMQHPQSTSVDINNTRYKIIKRLQSLIQNHMPVCIVSLLKSREWRYIKAINNNNKGLEVPTHPNFELESWAVAVVLHYRK